MFHSLVAAFGWCFKVFPPSWQRPSYSVSLVRSKSKGAGQEFVSVCETLNRYVHGCNKGLSIDVSPCSQLRCTANDHPIKLLNSAAGVTLISAVNGWN